jgi:hypothetical protein
MDKECRVKKKKTLFQTGAEGARGCWGTLGFFFFLESPDRLLICSESRGQTERKNYHYSDPLTRTKGLVRFNRVSLPAAVDIYLN